METAADRRLSRGLRKALDHERHNHANKPPRSGALWRHRQLRDARARTDAAGSSARLPQIRRCAFATRLSARDRGGCAARVGQFADTSADSRLVGPPKFLTRKRQELEARVGIGQKTTANRARIAHLFGPIKRTLSLLGRTPSLPFGAHFGARDILAIHRVDGELSCNGR